MLQMEEVGLGLPLLLDLLEGTTTSSGKAGGHAACGSSQGADLLVRYEVDDRGKKAELFALDGLGTRGAEDGAVDQVEGRETDFVRIAHDNS